MKIEKVLSDSTVKIRPLEAEDLDKTLIWRNDNDSRKWFKNDIILSWEMHQNWFNNYLSKDTDIVFAIESNTNAKLLGQVACYNINMHLKTAEVGRFLIDPQMRNKGYMHKAIQLLLKFCKEDLMVEFVYLEVLESNCRAINLYRKLGFSEVPSESASPMLKMNLTL